MKQITNFLIAALFIMGIALTFTACSDEQGCKDPNALNYDPDAEENCCCAYAPAENSYQATINFEHLVGSDTLMMNTTNLPYTNEAGQAFNVTRLRYMISDITFKMSNGEAFIIDEYHLVDLTDQSTLTFTPTAKIPEGNYESISFSFGFDPEDNVDGAYPDLNAANWSWPMMLGGGYHFMQLEGMYDSLGVNKFFATHMGTARNNNATPNTFEDNHFEAKPANTAINVGGDFNFTIKMDIAEWYKTPYTWDFTVYNAPIMPIYDAQRRLNLNGPGVFSITF